MSKWQLSHAFNFQPNVVFISCSFRFFTRKNFPQVNSGFFFLLSFTVSLLLPSEWKNPSLLLKWVEKKIYETKSHYYVLEVKWSFQLQTFLFLFFFHIFLLIFFLVSETASPFAPCVFGRWGRFTSLFSQQREKIIMMYIRRLCFHRLFISSATKRG